MTGQTLDHLLVDLLKDHEGVFLGERHDCPSVRQAVVEMLPLLKANGVGTLSVECPQPLINDMYNSNNFREFLTKWPGSNDIFRGYYKLVQAANSLGMKVLGHDKPDISDRYWKMDPQRIPQYIKDEKFSRDAYSTSEDGMNERNAYAAEYIRANRVGKVLVIGGSNHSGNYRREDLPLNKTLDDIRRNGPIDPDTACGRILADYSYYHSRAGAAYSGSDVKGSYQGLDARLGYPSVDFAEIGWLDGFLAGRHAGDTSATDGKFNNYVVFLPEDLGQLRITSLPAKTTTPKRQRERAQTMSRRGD